jgi:DNA-binding MarR family transcriptional regulator
MTNTPLDFNALMADSSLSLEHRTSYRFSVQSTLNMRCLAGLFIKKHKLSVAGWRIFSIIGRYEPVFPSVAAELSTMDVDKVTRAVDRLVEMNLVVRTSDTEDRRRVILRMSARGRTVYQEVESVGRAMEAELRSVLSAKEVAAFFATMDKIQAQGQRLFSGKDAWKKFMPAAAVKTPPVKSTPAKTPAAKTASARPAAAKRTAAKTATVKAETVKPAATRAKAAVPAAPRRKAD